MNIDSILGNVEATSKNIASIKSQVIQAKKIQLHPNIDGFISPDSHGIYRHTGGHCLGTVGKDFEPMDLGLFVDSIEQSVANCGGNDLDLSKLKYKEYKGGAKVSFDLEIGDKIISKSPMKGDILQRKLQFKTGFDGLTKVSLSFMSLRVWCSNGAASWKNDISLSFKNTKGNQVKISMFCDEIAKCISQSDQYVEDLNTLATRKITRPEIDAFLVKLTGFDLKETKEISTKARNILNAINACVYTETENTGMTAFSLLQGVTRYTTHNLAGGNEEVLLFDNARKLNNKAHELLLQPA